MTFRPPPWIPPFSKHPLRFPRRLLLAFASLLGIASLLAPRSTQASPFSYQGRLLDNNTLAQGTYELTFRLFDASTNGTPVGSPVTLPTVNVQNGIFTVELDFGTSPFDGSPRWLELSARPAGSPDPAETLAPRQPILAVPYAIRAFSGSGSGSGNASDLTSGTVPDARLAPTIARTADLLSTSNALASLWVDLSNQLTAMSNSLVAISNAAQATIPSGINVVSTDPADPGLTGQGFVRFLTIPAPGWKNTAAGGPTARSAHAAVWSGDSLYVWGGTLAGGTRSATGHRYDPALDQWFPLNPSGAPTARSGHSGIWTPQGLIIWGGFNSGYQADGSLLSTQSGQWSPLPSAPSFPGRDKHLTAWTGARMLLWGGRNASGLLQDGALYNPANSQWSTLPTANAPAARQDAAGAWTGTDFIVWGGLGTLGELGNGARLTLTNGATPGSWSDLPTSGAPSPRLGHSAVWTGSHLLVWGGLAGPAYRGDGAAYDPALNTWQPIPTTGAPAARVGHTAVWTGEEMLIFGGKNADGDLATGGAYHPGTGKWRPLPTDGSPIARHTASGVWSGTELLVFGGLQGVTPIAAPQRLNPQPTWHFYRKP